MKGGVVEVEGSEGGTLAEDGEGITEKDEAGVVAGSEWEAAAEDD